MVVTFGLEERAGLGVIDMEEEAQRTTKGNKERTCKLCLQNTEYIQSDEK